VAGAMLDDALKVLLELRLVPVLFREPVTA
jgi:hypothetical protein